MAVREDGLYLAERVRRLCDDRPLGVEPWKGREIHALLERASRFSGDHQLFYLTFLEGIRDLLDEDDADAVLVRFSSQALGSESRVLADSETTRDHLTHVTQVFLVGWVILNECGRFCTTGDEWKPYGWPVEKRFERLNRAWLYASLADHQGVQRGGGARHADRGRGRRGTQGARFGGGRRRPRSEARRFTLARLGGDEAAASRAAPADGGALARADQQARLQAGDGPGQADDDSPAEDALESLGARAWTRPRGGYGRCRMRIRT